MITSKTNKLPTNSTRLLKTNNADEFAPFCVMKQKGNSPPLRILTYHVNVVNNDEKEEWNEVQIDFVVDEEFKRISRVSMVVMDR